MVRIVSLGSALQDIYLVDHDDLVPTNIGNESIFGKVLVGSKVDIDRIYEMINNHHWLAAYANSKDKETMAKELAPYGIQVNAVAPGFVGTDMIKSIPGELAEKYLDSVPMKRFGTAEDVADCVASLLTDAFAYMTGQIIVLDGGLSL